MDGPSVRPDGFLWVTLEDGSRHTRREGRMNGTDGGKVLQQGRGLTLTGDYCLPPFHHM